MKYALLAFILLLTPALAQDIRERVVSGSKEPIVETEIDPDSHIYGIPFGTTENEFISTFGKPTGFIRLRGDQAGMLYGATHLFLFRDGKLSGIRISDPILDWIISRNLEPCEAFKGRKWKLKNGIQNETTQTKVKKLLGSSLQTNDYYQTYYMTDKAKVQLFFCHYTSEGEGDDAHKVGGILIEQQ